MHAIPFNRPFQATPRHSPQQISTDSATTGCNIIALPITGLYYLACYAFSCIAYAIGVTGISSRTTSRVQREILRNLGGEELAFFTEDGVKLEGMHFQAPNPSSQSKTILFCGGSHESFEFSSQDTVEAFLSMGHNVLLFNYRGFGKSKGRASEEGFNLDAEAAYQYLREVKHQPDDKIIAMGYSLGSAPATDLATHHRINLVLDRYFSSMSSVAYDMGSQICNLGRLGGSIAQIIFDLGDANFDIGKKIESVRGKIFLANGEHDITMHPYHRDILQGLLHGSMDRVHFQSVTSDHLHHNSGDLWYHHSSYQEREPKERLERFLSSGELPRLYP